MSDCENFDISDYDREFMMNPYAQRKRISKKQATYGVFLSSDSSSDESEMRYSRKNKKLSRDTDFQKPINFVSGGIKSGTNEKDLDSVDDDLPDIDIISDDSDDMRRSRKRSGEETKSNTNKKLKPANVKNALSGFASWEKNTKGFGTKMMQKMGYEPGKGLGPSGQGIVTPIEAVQRKQGKGTLGYYGAEKISKPLTAEEIKKSTKVINESIDIKAGKGLYKNDSKTVKTEYKTYDQIITESQYNPKKINKRSTDIDNVTSKVKIIDMSTSEVKVYTGYQNMYKQHPGDEDGSFSNRKHQNFLSWQERHLAAHKEIRFSANSLMKNLDMILKDTTDQLMINKNVLNEHTESKSTLNSEIEKLDKIKQLEMEEACDIENVLSFLQKFEEKMNCYDPNNVNEFVSWIEEARVRCKKYPQVIIAIGRPLLTAVTRNWRPLEKPFQGIEFFITCQDVLDNLVFEPLFRVTWLPILKQAIQYEWNPHKPTTLIELLDGWRPHIPDMMLNELLQNVIVVKLTAAVDSWNPCQDTIPIHSWLHPWIVYLGESLKPIYETVRYKLGICLNTWHASDDSAHAILLPWRTVFAPQNMSAFLKKYIEPKLTSVLRQIKIDPSRQDLEQWNWVMKWSDLLSPQCMEDMLMKEFFPRWMQVLTSWLNQANISRSMDAYQEIGMWYKGWMSQLPMDITELPSIKSIKKEALRLMATSRKGQHAHYVDHRVLAGQEQMLSMALGTDIKHAPMSMRERLEDYAQANGICFYPLAQKFYQDRQVYWFGERDQICFDKNFIYILNQNRWEVIGFNELIYRY